jgi:PncC family amidohydrolase
MVIYEDILVNSKKLGDILREKGWKIACAESCTGGLLSSIITEIPGSSDYFERGYITYSNKSKIEMLGVNKETIEKYGAVSFECAKEMVEKLNILTNCEVCTSITGIAGPTGGSLEKPVGLVYVGFCIEGNFTVEKLMFKGLRQEIRLSTVSFTIDYLIKNLYK